MSAYQSVNCLHRHTAPATVCVCVHSIGCVYTGGAINRQKLYNTYNWQICNFTLTCPGQDWSQRTSDDNGHNVGLPLRDARTHTVPSGLHNCGAMLQLGGSHIPNIYPDLEKSRSLGRDENAIKHN